VPDWILPSTVGALASVVWWLGRRVLSKLDELDTLMRTELRAMDVRIARIEEHLWPGNRWTTMK
jgi:hypothetical protein